MTMINRGQRNKKIERPEKPYIKANLILSGKLIKDGNSLCIPPQNPHTRTLILQDLSLQAVVVLKRNPKLNLSSPTSKDEKRKQGVRATMIGGSVKTKIVTKIKESKTRTRTRTRTRKVKRKLSMPAGVHSEIMILPSVMTSHTGLCQRSL